MKAVDKALAGTDKSGPSTTNNNSNSNRNSNSNDSTDTGAGDDASAAAPPSTPPTTTTTPATPPAADAAECTSNPDLMSFLLPETKAVWQGIKVSVSVQLPAL